VASEGPHPSLVDAGYCSDSNYDGSSFDGGVGVGIKAGIDFYAGLQRVDLRTHVRL